MATLGRTAVTSGNTDTWTFTDGAGNTATVVVTYGAVTGPTFSFSGGPLVGYNVMNLLGQLLSLVGTGLRPTS